MTVWLKNHSSERERSSKATPRNVFSWKIQYTRSSRDTHVTYNKTNPKGESQPRQGPSPQAGPLDTKAGPRQGRGCPECHGTAAAAGRRLGFASWLLLCFPDPALPLHVVWVPSFLLLCDLPSCECYQPPEKRDGQAKAVSLRAGRGVAALLCVPGPAKGSLCSCFWVGVQSPPALLGRAPAQEELAADGSPARALQRCREHEQV